MLAWNRKEYGEEAAVKIPYSDPSLNCSNHKFHPASWKPQGKGINIWNSQKMEKWEIAGMPV